MVGRVLHYLKCMPLTERSSRCYPMLNKQVVFFQAPGDGRGFTRVHLQGAARQGEPRHGWRPSADPLPQLRAGPCPLGGVAAAAAGRSHGRTSACASACQAAAWRARAARWSQPLFISPAGRRLREEAPAKPDCPSLPGRSGESGCWPAAQKMRHYQPAASRDGRPKAATAPPMRPATWGGQGDTQPLLFESREKDNWKRSPSTGTPPSSAQLGEGGG